MAKFDYYLLNSFKVFDETILPRSSKSWNVDHMGFGGNCMSSDSRVYKLALQ